MPNLRFCGFGIPGFEKNLAILWKYLLCAIIIVALMKNKKQNFSCVTNYKSLVKCCQNYIGGMYATVGVVSYMTFCT